MVRRDYSGAAVFLEEYSEVVGGTASSDPLNFITIEVSTPYSKALQGNLLGFLGFVNSLKKDIAEVLGELAVSTDDFSYNHKHPDLPVDQSPWGIDFKAGKVTFPVFGDVKLDVLKAAIQKTLGIEEVEEVLSDFCSIVGKSYKEKFEPSSISPQNMPRDTSSPEGIKQQRLTQLSTVKAR